MPQPKILHEETDSLQPNKLKKKKKGEANCILKKDFKAKLFSSGVHNEQWHSLFKSYFIGIIKIAAAFNPGAFEKILK